MNDEHFSRLEQLFQAARLLPLGDRAAFLDAVSHDDPEFRQELESLLEADAEATEEAFLEPAGIKWDDLFTDNSESHSLVGRQIGPYQVLRVLGKGGMGEVFLGLREAPYKRYVALKVIRQGLDSPEVVARFNIERQILASLEHPGIARLLDGGITQDGISYLAMEYVEGQPISRYCDESRLSIDERLQLFLKVCEAVHYAHQNLVLHRDLKPTNILVTPRGEVKLLDFGIAKLMNPQLSPLPVPITQEAQRLLTPEYASPEQIRGEPLSTASDVYSLGVLLYELLAGRRPHRLAGRSTQEMMRIVSDVEPAYPSTMVTRGGVKDDKEVDHPEEPAEIAQVRGMSTDRLRKHLRGDLDAIALMALRKEPGRRYGSAELLAQDIERHLSRQPVLARIGNRRYRLGRFIRRHRIESTAIAAVLIALLAGLGTALWQAREAQRERDRAVSAQAQAEEVAIFLENLFSASDPYAPDLERLDTLRVREFLSRGEERLKSELSDQPLVRAIMFDVIGRVYSNLGMYSDARPLIEQAIRIRTEMLGSVDPAVAASQKNLAVLLLQTGDFEEARFLLEETLEDYRSNYGNRHPRVAETMNHLARSYRELGMFDEAERTHMDAIETIRKSVGEDDVRLASFTRGLAATLEWKGDYEAAERYGREAIALQQAHSGSKHPELAIALRELGLVLQRKGEFAEAEKQYRESLNIVEEALGESHPQVVDLYGRLASVRWWQNDLEGADSLHQRSVMLNREIYGDEHIEVAYALNNWASVLRDKKAFSEADSLHLISLDIARSTVGEDHSGYWILFGNRGMTLRAMGNCELGEPTLRQAIDGMVRTFPNPMSRIPGAQRWLGACLMDLGRFEEAETTLLQSYTELEEFNGKDHHITRDAARLIVELYTQWDQPGKAQPYRKLMGGE